tara:strand:- start:3629 stop:4249 length:621 start_codon:yes stop_codon:yes gene_type:complete
MARTTGGKIQRSCLYAGPSEILEVSHRFVLQENISFNPSVNLLLGAESIMFVNNIVHSNDPKHGSDFSLITDPTKDEGAVLIDGARADLTAKALEKLKPAPVDGTDKFAGSSGDQQKDNFFDQDDPPSDNFAAQTKRTKTNLNSNRQINYFLAKAVASDKAPSNNRSLNRHSNQSKNTKYTQSPTKKKTVQVVAHELESAHSKKQQ